MIRFIHTADLHLDRPFVGLSHLPDKIYHRMRESTFTAFDTIIKKAIETKVDFIIIAGDIFDGSHRSFKAQNRFILGMRKLHQAGIHVYLSYGNHDHLNDDWNRLSFPGNVHVFPPEVKKFTYSKAEDIRCDLYGFSYKEKHIPNNMVPFYPEKKDSHYHIGILHGAEIEPSSENHYAPFSKSELIDLHYDYWALGHIHKREKISLDHDIWYPGNIQGLSKKEIGIKGASLVEMDHTRVHTSFFPTSDVIWNQEILNIERIETMDRVIRQIEQLKNEKRSQNNGTLLTLYIEGSTSLLQGRDADEKIEELLESVRDEEEERDDFVWIVSIINQTEPMWDIDELKQNNYFIGDVLKEVDSTNMESALSILYDHHLGKRYLGNLTDEVSHSIKREAEKLIVQALYKG
ncbi:metallophosphoesterase family protein [Terrilactibacillus laevilacticus]|uniref:metallophosphoesterase family protein n=1 Tax=Terrilactibacillus laevilacticus TaxID=1380157 RepID=UPI001147915A|nr:DNA repair exonuclease [Terrilactibacillus laevilacticus]